MSNNRNRNRNRAREIAGADSPFMFDHNGRVYKLPSAGPAVKNMKAGDMIDAMMDETEAAQIRLAIRTLEVAGPTDEAMDALRDMNVTDFSHVIMRWFKSGRVDPGKSGGSPS